MTNFFDSDFEIILTIILVPFFMILIYDKFKNLGKLYLNIFKMKINIINKNTAWLDSNNNIDDNTKYIELDFILQVFNNKNTNNSIYNLDIYKKKKRKMVLSEYHNLNLVDSMKMVSGSATYEKIKYLNLISFEVKEIHLKVKLSKEEYLNMKKEPIYLVYRNKKRKKKLKLSKYIKRDQWSLLFMNILYNSMTNKIVSDTRNKNIKWINGMELVFRILLKIGTSMTNICKIIELIIAK